MPLVRMNSFGATTFPSARQFWRWVDDVAEDSDVEDFITNNAYPQGTIGDVNVDRAGVDPVLRWQWYDMSWDSGLNEYYFTPTGNFGALPLSSAPLHINPSVYEPYPVDLYSPAAVDVTGWWECDRYGRPYDLNDLLA